MNYSTYPSQTGQLLL